MQEKITTYENEVIKYCIERSRRRTISIAVSANGNITVRAPLRISDKALEEIIREKLDWIIRKRLEIKEKDRIVRSMNYTSYKDGSNLLFEGKLYPLTIIKDELIKRSKIEFDGEQFVLKVNKEKENKEENDKEYKEKEDKEKDKEDIIDKDNKDKNEKSDKNEKNEYVRDILKIWYRQKARERFTERVRCYESYIQKSYGTIRIKEQKGCYGSCSAKGNLNFNWKCILAPPGILDYVVVHELCHLIYMNHSKEYWALVESIMPDYKKRRKWLKENGRLLDI